MSPGVYLRIRDRCADILATFFVHVTTPKEAPEKSDHGDVDYLVSSPLQYDGDWVEINIAPTDKNQQHGDPSTDLTPRIGAALGAVQSRMANSSSFCFAVPLPARAPSFHEARQPGQTTTFEEAGYAQIDITLCSSPSQLEWLAFTHSYGDVVPILGAALRPLNMSFTPHGFLLRIPCIESADLTSPIANAPSKQVASEMRLSESPSAVMRFLGLDWDAYASGFKTEDAAFQWISSSTCLRRDKFVRHIEDTVSADNEGLGTPGTTKQRAHDRRRKQTRKMYQRFADEWLPAHPEVCVEIGNEFTNRDMVVERAVDFFRKRQEYQRRLEAFHVTQTEAKFWRGVKSLFSEDKDKANGVIRGLRRWVKFEAGEPCIMAEAELDDNVHANWTATSRFFPEDLLRWVEKHSEQCKRLERERVKAEAEARRTTWGDDAAVDCPSPKQSTLGLGLVDWWFSLAAYIG